MAHQAAEPTETPQKPLLTAVADFLRTCDRTWLALSVVASLAIGVAFWPLLRELPYMWLGTGAWEFRTGDGYYSHGLLVPIIAGYIIYRRWPHIKETEVRPGWIAVLPLVFFLWVLWAANAVDLQQIRSYTFIVVLIGSGCAACSV